MKKILISGGSGEFPKSLIKVNTKFKIFSPSKKKMNVTSIKSIDNYLKKIKPEYFIHSAAFTKPMTAHKAQLHRSIDTNIIGTANIVKLCSEKNIKLIYISTNFVYPGTRGNYAEEDNLNPVNAYGWSKLGGECSVKLYKNSLILRICMNSEPYPHKYAFTNYITSFLYKSEAALIVLKLLDKKGVINVGGKNQSPYMFAIKNNKKIKKKKINSSIIKIIGKNTSLNTNKLKINLL